MGIGDCHTSKLIARVRLYPPAFYRLKRFNAQCWAGLTDPERPSYTTLDEAIHYRSNTTNIFLENFSDTLWHFSFTRISKELSKSCRSNISTRVSRSISNSLTYCKNEAEVSRTVTIREILPTGISERVFLEIFSKWPCLSGIGSPCGSWIGKPRNSSSFEISFSE